MDAIKILWLAAVIGFAVIEAATSQMICIWFSCSALISLISSALGAPLWLQLTLFILCTAALLIFTRPLARRVMNKPVARTNADRVIGMTGHVTEEVNNDVPCGFVNVSGQIWSARSVSGCVIPAGTKITVQSIEGVKLMVDTALDFSKKEELAARQI